MPIYSYTANHGDCPEYCTEMSTEHDSEASPDEFIKEVGAALLRGFFHDPKTRPVQSAFVQRRKMSGTLEFVEDRAWMVTFSEGSLNECLISELDNVDDDWIPIDTGRLRQEKAGE